MVAEVHQAEAAPEYQMIIFRGQEGIAVTIMTEDLMNIFTQIQLHAKQD